MLSRPPSRHFRRSRRQARRPSSVCASVCGRSLSACCSGRARSIQLQGPVWSARSWSLSSPWPRTWGHAVLRDERPAFPGDQGQLRWRPTRIHGLDHPARALACGRLRRSPDEPQCTTGSCAGRWHEMRCAGSPLYAGRVRSSLVSRLAVDVGLSAVTAQYRCWPPFFPTCAESAEVDHPRLRAISANESSPAQPTQISSRVCVFNAIPAVPGPPLVRRSGLPGHHGRSVATTGRTRRCCG